MKKYFCEDCPYYYNGTYRGHCEQIITMCDRRAREKEERKKADEGTKEKS